MHPAPIVIDHRMDRGGVGRYGRLLISGLQRLPEPFDLRVVTHESWTTAPFTPWGRRSVRRRTEGAALLHSLHLELPRVSVPSVVTIHDVIPLDVEASMPNRARRTVFRRLLEDAISRAATVIVPSEVTKASLERRGLAAGRIVVIPNAVDPVFVPSDANAVAAARARYASGDRYVAALWDERAHKSPRLLREVARRLESEGIRVRFAGAAGDGVDVVGRLDDRDLASFMGGADVFLLPSVIEGFGLPLLEAAACGTPGVATAGVGALPYLRDGVVEVDLTSDAVTAAVLDLLGDDDLHARRAAGARSAASELTVAAMARATAGVYVALLG